MYSHHLIVLIKIIKYHKSIQILRRFKFIWPGYLNQREFMNNLYTYYINVILSKILTLLLCEKSMCWKNACMLIGNDQDSELYVLKSIQICAYICVKKHHNI